MSRLQRWSIAVVIGTVYLVSLFAPVGYTCGPLPRSVDGWVLLAYGWIGIAFLQVGWLANVLFVALLIGFTRPRAVGGWGVLFAAAMVIVALTSLTLTVLPAQSEAGGGTDQMCGFGHGFFLWEAAIVGLGLATWVKLSTGVRGD